MPRNPEMPKDVYVISNGVEVLKPNLHDNPFFKATGRLAVSGVLLVSVVVAGLTYNEEASALAERASAYFQPTDVTATTID